MKQGWICGPRIYEYDGWVFEFGAFGGPWPLKKDLCRRKRAGRTFWKMIGKFDLLTSKEKDKYCVGGGCMPIG